MLNNLPSRRQHSKNDGADQPHPALQPVGFLFDPIHLGLVFGEHFKDVDLAGFNPGRMNSVGLNPVSIRSSGRM